MPALRVISTLDREFLALGRELDRIERDWRRQREADERHAAARSTLLELRRSAASAIAADVDELHNDVRQRLCVHSLLRLALPALRVISAADSELLALGCELDKVERDCQQQREVDIAAKEAACEALGLGLRERDPPYDGDDRAWRDWKAFHRRRDMVRFSRKAEGAAEESDDPWSTIRDGLFKLLSQAMAIRATTIAGLAVQLRCFDLASGDFIDDPHVRSLRTQARKVSSALVSG
jgi:hypothetical protein